MSILQLLHDANSDVNSRTRDNWTPLHTAVEQDHLEVVKLLLEWGADPFIQTSGQESSRVTGLSALSMAQELGRKPEMLLMLENATSQPWVGAGSNAGPAKKQVEDRKTRPLTENKCQEENCEFKTFRPDLFGQHMTKRHQKEDIRFPSKPSTTASIVFPKDCSCTTLKPAT